MKLELVRESFTEKATEGMLYVDGAFECHTLEDKDRKIEDGGTKIYGKTAIPRGEYKLVLSMSNRFKKILPEILDVEGFTGIRIHVGNTSSDTDGCILVGSNNKSSTDDFIGASKVAFDKLMKKLQAASDDIYITVV